MERIGRENLSFKERVIARYDSGILYTDTHIERFFSWLKSNDLFDNTIIIITSDHGENFDFIDNSVSSGAHGITLSDQEIHIPIIIGGAKPFNKGIVSEKLVSNVDILPTVLEILGIPLEYKTRGINLNKIINDNDSKKRIVFAEGLQRLDIEMKAVRSEDYKYIESFPLTDELQKSIGSVLYNMQKDRLERKDISVNEKNTVIIYREILYKIVSSIGEKRKSLITGSKIGSTMNEEQEKQLRALGYLGN
jgi:arylsulfatase A-like enzyme